MNDILLSQFKPKSELIVKEHTVKTPKFPVIDFHTHYGNDTRYLFDIESTVQLFNDSGVTGVVNLNGFWGERLDNILEYTKKYSDRFITFGSVDFTNIADTDFARNVSESMKKGYKKGMRGLKFFKNLSLEHKLPVDDKRLRPIWETAAELKIPILIHIADPFAFFRPIDGYNERFEELNCFPHWSFAGEEFFSFEELMEMQENMLSENPDTTFVIAHVGSVSENLEYVAQQLDRHPNMYIDIAARIAELGRQPYTSRSFMTKYQDRILFGTDINPTSGNYFPYYFRFMETFDEYFDYNQENDQGRWKIYGIGLPDETLKKIYYENAIKLVPEFAQVIKK